MGLPCRALPDPPLALLAAQTLLLTLYARRGADARVAPRGGAVLAGGGSEGQTGMARHGNGLGTKPHPAWTSSLKRTRGERRRLWPHTGATPYTPRPCRPPSPPPEPQGAH